MCRPLCSGGSTGSSGKPTPAKVAAVVAFLFTDAASAINGITIPVDDGFLIHKNG